MGCLSIDDTYINGGVLNQCRDILASIGVYIEDDEPLFKRASLLHTSSKGSLNLSFLADWILAIFHSKKDMIGEVTPSVAVEACGCLYSALDYFFLSDFTEYSSKRNISMKSRVMDSLWNDLSLAKGFRLSVVRDRMVAIFYLCDEDTGICMDLCLSEDMLSYKCKFAIAADDSYTQLKDVTAVMKHIYFRPFNSLTPTEDENPPENILSFNLDRYSSIGEYPSACSLKDIIGISTWVAYHCLDALYSNGLEHYQIKLFNKIKESKIYKGFCDAMYSCSSDERPFMQDFFYSIMQDIITIIEKGSSYAIEVIENELSLGGLHLKSGDSFAKRIYKESNPESANYDIVYEVFDTKIAFSFANTKAGDNVLSGINIGGVYISYIPLYLRVRVIPNCLDNPRLLTSKEFILDEYVDTYDGIHYRDAAYDDYLQFISNGFRLEEDALYAARPFELKHIKRCYEAFHTDLSEAGFDTLPYLNSFVYYSLRDMIATRDYEMTLKYNSSNNDPLDDFNIKSSNWFYRWYKMLGYIKDYGGLELSYIKKPSMCGFRLWSSTDNGVAIAVGKNGDNTFLMNLTYKLGDLKRVIEFDLVSLELVNVDKCYLDISTISWTDVSILDRLCRVNLGVVEKMVNTNSFVEQLQGVKDYRAILEASPAKILQDAVEELKADKAVDSSMEDDDSSDTVKEFAKTFDVEEWIASQPAVNSSLLETFISKETKADRDTLRVLGIEGANADFYRQLWGLIEYAKILGVEKDRITFFDDMCGSLSRTSKITKDSSGIAKKSWLRECAARIDLALERMDEGMKPRCNSNKGGDYSLFFALSDDVCCAVILRSNPLYFSVGIQTKGGEREIAILPI